MSFSGEVAKVQEGSGLSIFHKIANNREWAMVPGVYPDNMSAELWPMGKCGGVDQSILWTFSTKVALRPASPAPSMIWFTNDNSEHTPLIFHLFRVKCNLNIMIWYQMNWKWISGNWMNPVKKRNLKQVAWGIICVWNDLRQFVRWPEYLLINVK